MSVLGAEQDRTAILQKYLDTGLFDVQSFLSTYTLLKMKNEVVWFQVNLDDTGKAWSGIINFADGISYGHIGSAEDVLRYVKSETANQILFHLDLF